MTRNQKIIFWTLLGLAALLLFFRLGRQDMLGDDGHYAARALGYFDYMGSLKQTTPIQWFGFRPAWSYLSFHDHPPLYFLTQNVIFSIFGDSVAVSRLISVFAALGSLAVIYLLARRFGGVMLGLLSMVALIFNNYFIWTGRIGLLESLMVFLMLAGLLFLMKGLQVASKYFIWAGLFFGLALLTKYSVLFVLPAVIIYLLWHERQVFRQKYFWIGAAVFLILLTPLVIYNLNMYETRGHFDVQISDLLGQRHDDWTLLQSRVGGAHFAFQEFVLRLAQGVSWPYFLLFIAAVLAALYSVARRRKMWLCLPLLCVAISSTLLTYVGSSAGWLGILSPFAALLLAAFWEPFFTNRAIFSLAALLFIYLSVFIFYTNHSVGPSDYSVLSSSLRRENLGYNQLDGYISELMGGKIIPYKTREAVGQLWFNKVNPEALPFLKAKIEVFPFNPLFVYDDNTNWFPMNWLFGRYRNYNGVPSMTVSELAKLKSDPSGQAIVDYLNFEEVYYIHVANDVGGQDGDDFVEYVDIKEQYEAREVRPDVIRDLQGREAFYIYHSPKIRL